MSHSSEKLNTAQVAYVALGIARGHLMSAAVVRSLLLSHGYVVSVYTTSQNGKVFFEAITGFAPFLLSSNFGFTYDEGHNLQMRKSILQVMRYMLSKQLQRDIACIRDAVVDRMTLINDIHPAPMLLQRIYGRSPHVRLVNVLSEHSLGAVEQLCTSWLPGIAGKASKAKIGHIFTNCSHTIINTLDPAKFFFSEGNITFLPPIVEPAYISVSQVRERLGVADEQPLFVAYMNPLFRRRELLQQLVDLTSHFGAFLYVVSESLATLVPPKALKQICIVPYDFQFGEKIRAADLLISAAGIAAPVQAYAYGVPLIVLVTSQPEHQRNAQTIADAGMGMPIQNPEDLLEVATKTIEYERKPHMEIIERTRDCWLSVISSSVARRGENDG